MISHTHTHIYVCKVKKIYDDEKDQTGVTQHTDFEINLCY